MKESTAEGIVLINVETNKRFRVIIIEGQQNESRLGLSSVLEAWTPLVRCPILKSIHDLIVLDY